MAALGPADELAVVTRIVLLSLVMVTATGSVARAEHTEVVATPAPAAHSLWRGRYECAQGATALTLTLDLTPGGAATAVFDFGPLPENPSVPTGRYVMRGTLAPSPPGATLTLSPDRWISRPADYVMVGLRMRIDEAMTTMSGRVDGPSCSVVSLVRVQ
jgi:hypothetical protein